MNAISEYAKNIAIFLIFMAFIGIIIPSEKYKKYINLICGFILMILVLMPVLNLISGNELSINNLQHQMEINLNRNIIQRELDNHDEAALSLILEVYKSDLESQMKNLITARGFIPLEINFYIDTGRENFGTINHISATVSQGGALTQRDSIINIERITIGPQISSRNRPSLGDTEQEDINPEIKSLKNFLADFYNLSVSNIHIKETQ